ncbi:ChaN family lipoprotein [uncultured Pseudodesulfovibrio sp.]|uniref:ChaN family lipoprotein n=1 Tax=uncultured Pseudodesulfovibrio sp. TaxID=2035858 RepID=UPI0029C6277F|nr:ChaN family lipoprotein [uncultured Pseudodesulfovibrio sp.]
MIEHILRTARKGAMWLCLPGLVLALGACVKNAPEMQAQPIGDAPMAVTFLPQKGDFISNYGQPLSLAEVAAMAKGYDYILIGEGHRNPVDHKVQQALLEALSDNGEGLSMGLEMVGVDRQQELDDFCKGQVSLDGLPEELDWATNWGYDFGLFRDHFAIAKDNGVPVAGLNVPSAVVRKITKDGLDGLSDEEKALLPKEIVPPATDQRAFLNAVMAMHRNKDAKDEKERERFYLVQSIWDSKMAEQAVRLRNQYDWPVLVIAGAGHVEYGWGIAKRIRWFDPAARILTIMPWRGGEFDSEAGDLFFYSPDSYRSRMGMVLSGQADGILVESVSRGSRAARAGLRPGDMLIEASGIPLEGLFSLHMAGTKVHDADEPLVFTVLRGGQTFTADLGKLGKSRPDKMPEDKPEPESAPKPEPKTVKTPSSEAR